MFELWNKSRSTGKQVIRLFPPGLTEGVTGLLSKFILFTGTIFGNHRRQGSFIDRFCPECT